MTSSSGIGGLGSSSSSTNTYGNFGNNPTNTGVASGTSPCDSQSCCDQAGCVQSCPTNEPPDDGNGGGGSRCNTQCCEWQYALGITPGGCYCGCGNCDVCVDNRCTFSDQHCECQEFAPQCQQCLENGEWADDPYCQTEEELNACICARKGDDYCKFTCNVTIDADSNYVPNSLTVCKDFAQPINGWVLTNKSCSNGLCTFYFCSQASGEIDPENCLTPKGERCCAGGAQPVCKCTHTKAVKGTGETSPCGGSWCTSLPGQEGHVPPPSSWIKVSQTSTEVCYREKMCTDTGTPGSGTCQKTCPDGVEIGECSCVSCHCNSECPPGKNCELGQCVSPPPPPSPSP